MKKLWTIAIVAIFFFAACTPKTTEVVNEEEQTQETKCCLTDEQKADFAAFENWAELDDAAKGELIVRLKEFYDAKMAKKAEKCDAEPQEVCPEKQAKCDEFKAKWETWETLSIDEQKALIDELIGCCKKKCEAKEESTEEVE